MKYLRIFYALSFFCSVALPAQPVLFDFNSGPIHTSLPITLSVSGITAHFSATGDGFSIQDYFGNNFIPIGFSGLFLSPNSVFASDLVIHFDQTLTDFSILYAPEEYGCDSSATMRVTAYLRGSYVGTTTKIASTPGTWPVDTLRCSFPQGFDSVVVHYDHHPLSGCTDWGPIFAADDMTVTPSAVQLPIVTTNAATNITDVSAVLNGTVDANGSTTTAMFEWGTTDAYGNFAPPETITVAASPKAISFTLTPLSPSVTYHYRVTATNSGGTSNSADGVFTTADTISIYSTIKQYWNMVSVPVNAPDYTKATLYPTAVSDAFAYLGGYVTTPVLATGTGYWLRFDSAQTVVVAGMPCMQNSVPVQTGWNLIGSISVPVGTSSISSIPAGLIASDFFGYSHSYLVSDTIWPGSGYWVKTNGPGILVISSAGTTPANNPVRFIPNNELPPPPPDEQRSGFTPGSSAQFALDQNYPNPFNPVTTFRFRVSAFGMVTLKIYNPVGEVVSTVVNEELPPGEYRRSWAAGTIASGVYFYRLLAGNTVEMKTLVFLR